MKKLLVLLLLLGTCVAFAQTVENDTIPPYRKTLKIPEFAVLQTDSTWFTNKQLPGKKPVVIIWFSPDCGHCQMTAEAFVKEMDKLKNVAFVWASYATPEQIKEFGENYKLNRFPNVVLGRDPNYKIPVFYKVQFTPFMAVYNKNGTFLNAYPQGTNPDEIVRLLKNGK